MEKDFDHWNGIKKATDGADETTRLYFREGEVWWVRLGKNIGCETDGKSREFTRPVIILKKYNQFISGASTHDRAEAQSLSSPDRDRGRQAGVRNALAASQYRQQAPRQKDQPPRRRYPCGHKERGQPRKLRLVRLHIDFDRLNPGSKELWQVFRINEHFDAAWSPSAECRLPESFNFAESDVLAL
jgi:hypothetical protein